MKIKLHKSGISVTSLYVLDQCPGSMKSLIFRKTSRSRNILYPSDYDIDRLFHILLFNEVNRRSILI